MKPGARALGVAESYRGERSTLAGVVVRADRTVDGFAFGSCTVGGTDVTASVADLIARLDREDVRHVLVAGVALAWYNVLDLDRLADETDRPVVAVTFEESDGLADGIRDAFDGDERAERLAAYRTLPERRRLDVGDGTLFYRTAGVAADDAAAVLRAHTTAGARPEPLRVARLAARAADAWRRGDDAADGNAGTR